MSTDGQQRSAGTAGAVIRIGCSGWNYRDWRGALYPRAARAALAGGLRRALRHRRGEHDLLPAAARDGGGAVGERRRTASVRRQGQPLPDARQAAARRRATASPAWASASSRSSRPAGSGPTLWQLPANFHRDDERLAGALDALPPAGTLRVPPPELVRRGGRTSCCAARRPRSSSATTRSARSRPASPPRLALRAVPLRRTAAGAATTPERARRMGTARSAAGAARRRPRLLQQRLGGVRAAQRGGGARAAYAAEVPAATSHRAPQAPKNGDHSIRSQAAVRVAPSIAPVRTATSPDAP